LQTIQDNPVPMDFRLAGIWEVCGNRRALVEDAFRKYGRNMRPLLHVETRTPVPPQDDYRPGVFLSGQHMRPDAPKVPYRGYGGYQLLIIDRLHPYAKGVVLNRLYSVPGNTPPAIKEVSDTIIEDIRAADCLDNGYFYVLVTFGMLNSFPPTTELVRVLQETGAGGKLDEWLRSIPVPFTTTHEVNYILIGTMKSGPKSGVEGLALIPMGQKNPYTSSADVYFYSLGPDQPFVLGDSETQLF